MGPIPEIELKANTSAGPLDPAVVQKAERMMRRTFPPEDLIPFAALFPGDFLCFDFWAGQAPAVVWWNHDLSVEDAPHTEPVAPSFADFLGQLRTEA